MDTLQDVSGGTKELTFKKPLKIRFHCIRKHTHFKDKTLWNYITGSWRFKKKYNNLLHLHNVRTISCPFLNKLDAHTPYSPYSQCVLLTYR